MSIPSYSYTCSTFERTIAYNSASNAAKAGRSIASGKLVPGAVGFRPGMLSMARRSAYKAVEYQSLSGSLASEIESLHWTVMQLHSIYDGLEGMKSLAETAHKNNNSLTSSDLNGLDVSYKALKSAIVGLAYEYNTVGIPESALVPYLHVLPDYDYNVFLSPDDSVYLTIVASEAYMSLESILSSGIANVTSAGNAIDQLASAVSFVLLDISKYETDIEAMNVAKEMADVQKSGAKDVEGELLEVDIPELMQTIADDNLAIQKALKIVEENINVQNIFFDSARNIF